MLQYPASAGTTVCTKDINEFGFPSRCLCDNEMELYTPEIGKCEVVLACTKDINEYGNPSICQCPANHKYNPKSGECVEKFIQICTMDINPYGFASNCSCPDGKDYNPTNGQCEDE